MGRVAIYYAPLPSDPLTRLSTVWLGRDPVTNTPVDQPDIDNLPEITADPRLYGFHATLKPPMRLIAGAGWQDLMAAVHAMAATLAPFTLPPLSVQNLHGFLALRETEPSPALQALADTCVEVLDCFRTPPTEEDLVRRRKASLTPEQDSMLQRWGYPYVFSTWFFHMTLTRRLSPEERARIKPAAEAWFAPALSRTRHVSDVCVFTQSAPGGAFVLAERVRLGGKGS
jgi:putative phosphonate metabolism protein